MWQLTPPYKAHLYICFTANKCSHKYELIVGMSISEIERVGVRRSRFDRSNLLIQTMSVQILLISFDCGVSNVIAGGRQAAGREQRQ